MRWRFGGCCGRFAGRGFRFVVCCGRHSLLWAGCWLRFVVCYVWGERFQFESSYVRFGGRGLFCAAGSAMGGYARNFLALTEKWGWSVCIIAYNDNASKRRRDRIGGPASGGVVNRGRCIFAILQAARVTLSPFRFFAPFRPASSFFPFFLYPLPFSGFLFWFAACNIFFS